MITLEFMITRYLHIPKTNYWEQRIKEYSKSYQLYSDILYDINTMCSTDYIIYRVLIDNEWIIITKENVGQVMKMIDNAKYMLSAF